MRWTLKEVLKQTRIALKKMINKRDKWIKEWPGQVKNGFFFVVNLFKIIEIVNFVFNLSLKQAKKQKIGKGHQPLVYGDLFILGDQALGYS